MSSSGQPFTMTMENEARDLLVNLPDRWGRMDLMSRSALTGVGRALSEAGLLAGDAPVLHSAFTGGLIAGSRKGSLLSDLDYAETLKLGPGMASPHLFGYTLPSIALAEAAIQYRLTGPVFILIGEYPLEHVIREAEQWLVELPGKKKIMVAGILDVIPGKDAPAVISEFKIVQH